MDANMQQLEIVEQEINFINRSFCLLSSENGGKLSVRQIEMRDNLIADRLTERDAISAKVKQSQKVVQKLDKSQHNQKKM
jgi:hypothetical protein